MKLFKRILIGITIVTVLIIVGGYFLLARFLKAAGEECETELLTKIRDYEVMDKSCIGFAGPRYSTYYLYENGQNIGTGKRLDSCTIQFRQKHMVLKFNTCLNELKESKIEFND